MDTGPPRKRLRRSTRTCYQCRKRKVKCQLTDENVDTCAECVKSGAKCTLQPPEGDDEAGIAGSSGGSAGHVDGRGEYDSRLERIEALLNRLVEAHEPSGRPAGDSIGLDPTVPDPVWNDFLLQTPPIGTFGSVDDHGLIMPLPAATPDSKQTLVSLLPSAHDAAIIATNTTAWLWGAEKPPGSVLKPEDNVQLLDVATVSTSSEMHVAKTLLLFALYMQQLPASFDQFLESQSVEQAIELIVERVKRFFLVTHEDEAHSLDGVECLTLLAVIHLNDGAIHKAWTTFRRVLDMARLKGLHKSFALSARSLSCGEVALHRRLWLSAICGDCYCSLLLGLEPAIGVAPFGPDGETWSDPLADDEATIQRRIGLIIARIAQRNAVGLQHGRSILQEVDKALNELQDSLPASWWRVPSFPRNRSLDSAKEPNRLVCQLWFFQAKMFAHLPVAFGKTTSDSLVSLECCMETSRITLHRYLGLQHARDNLSRCRTVDQAGFLAAFVLLLAQSQLRYNKTHSVASRYDSDQALLEQVIDSFEVCGKGSSREHAVRDISDILSNMLEIVTSDPNSSSSSESGSSSDIRTHPFALGASTKADVTAGSKEASKKATRSEMEDIIASSIRPALEAHTPAARVVDLLFSTRQYASREAFELSGRQGDVAFDDLVM